MEPIQENSPTRPNDEEFLDAFKELEAYVVSISKLNDDYVSFSRALNKVHFDNLNPVIADNNTFDFLKTASDLRNLLSHRNDVCMPTDDFLNKFIKISNLIIHPYNCYDLSTKDIISINYGTPISEVCRLMVKYSLSHLPILVNGVVKGVFSRTTFFEAYSKVGSLTLDDDTYTVADFKTYCDLHSHSSEFYLFVDKEASMYDAITKMKKKNKHEKRVCAIFITDDGSINGKLVGLITESDLILQNLLEK